MKKINILLAMLSVAAITFTSCKDDKDDTSNSGPAQPGTVTLDLTNVAGTVNVDETGATSYTNSSGESFTVTKLKYYISNVRLLNADSVVYSLPDGYFLVDESNQASTKLSLPNVPGGAYTSIKFTLGVDSARNVSGAQTGALDPANGMFWTWSSGYIFYKLEGTSPAATGGITYHIGGFRDANNTNAIREVEVDFMGSSLQVDGSREAEIHVLADVLKVFSTPNTISIASINFQMSPGGNALLIADNYAQMFSFDHLHNDH
jgi:hypothetical protein